MKNLVSVSDLSKEDILKIFDYAAKFEDGKTKPYGFATGKILGTVFLQDSLRTSASLKSAMLKLGGSWIDFDLSYVKSGEEDLEDSLMAIAPLVDVIGIRGPSTIDIRPISKKIKTPLVNAMIGMEHSIGAIWYAYTIWRKLKRIENITIGMYGLTGYSRPSFALYRLLSKLGVTFIEDSIIDKAGAPSTLVEEVKGNWGKFSKGKFEDFVKKVDFLFVAEGLPVKGADENVVNEFNKKYTPLNKQMIRELRKDALFAYCMPRALTDGRLAAEKNVDDDPRLISYEVMDKSVYATMGTFAWLFE